MRHHMLIALNALAVAAVCALAPVMSGAAPPTTKPSNGPFAVPVNQPLGYQVEMNRQFSSGPPFTGALVFTVNAEGILNGIYESDSIRPDPLYGRRVTVTGTISKDNRIQLQIGVGSVALTVRGTINAHHISASAANASLGILQFNATRVHLHKPPSET
ncbi:MAG TPA: hypothetical protein VGX02_09930 [Candidatus Eremiobacteraceae bacterium]|nr:hypothetical protein [Candidatus Eremiobacteraceae bacterium]